MKYDNQLRYAVQIIETFDGKMPLHNWLKNFFRTHKQMGSKDRKRTSEMAYCFYRIGHAEKNAPIEERILTGLFLCNHSSNEILQYFKPTWNEHIDLKPEEKTAMIWGQSQVSPSTHLKKIFPWTAELSNGIDHVAFCTSFLKQPDLFIRLRPGFEDAVKKKLSNHSITYREIHANCLSFANTTRLEELIELNKEAVIQDMSSQRVGSFLEMPIYASTGKTPMTWDCCAGSGGKSIMLYDMYPAVELTVSDNRESILINLKKRFKEAGIRKYQAFAADITMQHIQHGKHNAERVTFNEVYDLIIADVPCSGSGTWGRNPDALYFFDIHETERYQTLQKKILSNIIPCLKKGGVLVYITCSVFKKENEEVADFVRQTFNLRMEKMELLKGYDQKADSLFVARFIA